MHVKENEEEFDAVTLENVLLWAHLSFYNQFFLLIVFTSAGQTFKFSLLLFLEATVEFSNIIYTVLATFTNFLVFLYVGG